MADASRDLTVYEVRCHSCNVSFPPGTKRCIHCGERIGRPRLLPGRGDEMPEFAGGDPFPEAREAAAREAEEAEVEPSGGRGLRVGFTLLWLFLALISALSRSCQGDG
jgi:hypothetical protein